MSEMTRIFCQRCEQYDNAKTTKELEERKSLKLKLYRKTSNGRSRLSTNRHHGKVTKSGVYRLNNIPDTEV